MRKMGWKLAGLGVIAGAVLLTGCGDDFGRRWAMMPQDDYLPDQPQAPAEGSAMGGSGAVTDSRANALWLKQDFRVPYPPDQMAALVAPNLGTGKPLRANAKGVWVQGLYAVEVGSGLITSSSPTSAPYQPQERPVGNFSTPRSLPAHNSGN
ncbi:hypothetical protein [Melittangium boletus]|uniref:Lipoprotein n=2 Tax=Melittangium boletus TaxID=83453 RepID=A0A250ID95_9BACT|nr:hypothetical protein [Melittangium boletus]ATB28926.1 hypothetical protein MEBOL_002375 [Melittangium boletus DSM 14713]AYM53176.1 hypothetical protein [Melittangium boletus]